jgi:hypothetical protein
MVKVLGNSVGRDSVMLNDILGELPCLMRYTADQIPPRDLYLWASTIIGSRAFSSKVLSGVIPGGELPEENVSVLLPFIDILNHRPLAKVEWRAGKNDVGFLVLENVPAGQEIANNYGPRNNEQRKFRRRSS